MSLTSGPFPAHVPTLTEVVEEPLIEAVEEDGAVVSDFVSDLVAQTQAASGLTPQHVAVLTDVVLEHDLPAPTGVAADADAQQALPATKTAAEPALAASGSASNSALDSALEPGSAQWVDQLTERVLTNLDGVVEPVMMKYQAQLLADLRESLAQGLREQIAQMVREELTRLLNA